VISHHTTAKTPKDGILKGNCREPIGKNAIIREEYEEEGVCINRRGIWSRYGK